MRLPGHTALLFCHRVLGAFQLTSSTCTLLMERHASSATLLCFHAKGTKKNGCTKTLSICARSDYSPVDLHDTRSRLRPKFPGFVRCACSSKNFSDSWIRYQCHGHVCRSLHGFLS